MVTLGSYRLIWTVADSPLYPENWEEAFSFVRNMGPRHIALVSLPSQCPNPIISLHHLPSQVITYYLLPPDKVTLICSLSPYLLVLQGPSRIPFLPGVSSIELVHLGLKSNSPPSCHQSSSSLPFLISANSLKMWVLTSWWFIDSTLGSQFVVQYGLQLQPVACLCEFFHLAPPSTT